jgi:deoxyribose-phosphate aldolase
MLDAAKQAIKGSSINLAAVSTGFPAGLSPLPLRLQEIEYSVNEGANEIDIVISRRLCSKARQPISINLEKELGIESLNLSVAAVCVYHDMLDAAKQAIKGSSINLAAVSTGFPAGLSPLPLRLQEIEYSVNEGANEIDIVISRRHVLEGNWKALYEEVKMFREQCGDAHMKTILATGELGNLTNIAKASQICMMAGADFIKTSTGKESVNAALPVSLVMVRMIRDYYIKTGISVGFKAAGGISDTKTALLYMTMIKEELGRRCTKSKQIRL